MENKNNQLLFLKIIKELNEDNYTQIIGYDEEAINPNILISMYINAVIHNYLWLEQRLIYKIQYYTPEGLNLLLDKTKYLLHNHQIDYVKKYMTIIDENIQNNNGWVILLNEQKYLIDLKKHLQTQTIIEDYIQKLED